MIFSLKYLYYLLGFILIIVAFLTYKDKTHPKRVYSSIFWFIYAMLFLVGDSLAPSISGALVVIMALLAGFGKVSGAKHPIINHSEDKRLGNILFIPALTIPFTAVICTILLKQVKINS